MGHDVRYEGKLIFTQPLTQEQEDFIETFRMENQQFADVEYIVLKIGLYVNNDGIMRLKRDSFYCTIKKFVIEFKKLGNDFTTDSYLVSCSEYGLDDEAVILSYKTGEFVEKPVLELINEYLSK